MRRICMSLILMFSLLPALLSGVAAEEIDTIQLQMNVLGLEKHSASVPLGQEHSWYIRCFFPEDTQTEGQYTVIQTLSPGLACQTDSVEVYWLPINGESVPFAMEEMYILTAGSVFVEGGTADRISISLTETGRTFLSGGGELRITYQAKLKETAPIGTQLIGTAQLNYLDPEGNRTVCLSDKAAVSTGGLRMRLSDPAGSPLSGGEFMLAREASSEELADASLTIELLDTGEENLAVVYMPFCPSEDLTEDRSYTVKTNREGDAVCFGLAYGEYYLVQIQAAEGTGLPAAPVKVTVNEVSHLTAEDGWKDIAGNIVDHTVFIVNGALVMPQTGGPGAYGYTVAGTMVILSACLLLWFNRKRRIYV